ncbi:fructosamine kinase family protein [Kribbella jiaozuonensis]|uniref:Fructosamine kinase n=1 Tax=Kribbella jiaozuonensis TaxID=2575441 RepID=A0A4U3LJS4_9ACTN|nr:fructosamine kinase family protein [Kribbella jiaozuonensis]TKK75958.1 fructosamine kinase [Kribbella jiaozuonensis]
MTAGFVKSWPDAPPRFFAVEAAGLRWLAVPGGVPVAEPLDVSPTQLTTTMLQTTPPTDALAEDFGRRLAVTHDAGARHYGVPPDRWNGDGYIGTIALPHAAEPMTSWGEFYANLRLRPYLRAAGVHLDVFERLCGRLEAGVYDDVSDGPSRIHGDLWSGNVLWTAAGVHLIDPAAHGGHRETDLAMLGLFGLPKLERVLRAYDEVHPLADGWRDRIRLHQLHPLLVHVVLFGGGYLAQATALAKKF